MKIGVVGSMQFTEEMLKLCDQLIQLGHKVVISDFADSFIGKTEDEKEKIKLHYKFNEDAIRKFWQKMQNLDAVLVANFDKNGIKNYIGGNTLMEIGFAHVLNLKIFLLNPIPDIPFYRTEIEAVKPIILNGDINNLSRNLVEEGVN